MMAAARRHGGDAEQAAVAVRSLRRRELFRVAAADVLGLIGLAETGRGADRDHHGLARRRARRRDREGRGGAALPAADPVRGDRDGPLRRARVRLRQRRRRHLRARAAARAWRAARQGETATGGLGGGAGGRRRAAPAAADPGARPAAGGGRRPAAGRQAGPAGPVARPPARPTTRAAPLPWEWQALLRAEFAVGDAELGAKFVALADQYRYPAGGLSDQAAREIRRIKARVEAERIPRGDGPRTAPQARPRRPVRRGVDRPAAAAAARRRRRRPAHHQDPRGPGRGRRGRPGRRARRGRAARGVALRGPDQERDHAGPRPSRRHPARQARRAHRGRPPARLQAGRRGARARRATAAPRPGPTPPRPPSRRTTAAPPAGPARSWTASSTADGLRLVLRDQRHVTRGRWRAARAGRRR